MWLLQDLTNLYSLEIDSFKYEQRILISSKVRGFQIWVSSINYSTKNLEKQI